ncbi:hypothetical protein ABVT39_027188 [Epinephelus coioides]
MGTLLVAVGLLCLCGVSMSYDSCRQALLRDVDFPGSDIKHVTSPDAEHCQLLCTQHPACRFFTFLRPDWTRDNRQFFCYLKASPSGQPRVQNTLHGHTSGFSLKPCNPDPKSCLRGVYHHVDFPGADFRTLFTANYEECQRECTRDPACQFFTFIKGNYRDERTRYKCYLKFSWTVPRTPTVLAKGGIVSGFSHNLPINSGHCTTGNLILLPKVVLIGATTSAGCCRACFLIGLLVYTACQGKLFPNTDVPGHDVKVLPAASPEHCQILCSAHHHCTFFAYVSHQFNCYLKNNPHAMNPRYVGGITSGLPTRFCQLDTIASAITRESSSYLLLQELSSWPMSCLASP